MKQTQEIEANLKAIIDAELRYLEQMTGQVRQSDASYSEDPFYSKSHSFGRDVDCIKGDYDKYLEDKPIFNEDTTDLLTVEAIIHGIVQIYQDYGIKPHDSSALNHINKQSDKRNKHYFEDRTRALVMQYLYVTLIAAVALTVFTVGHLGLIPFLAPGSHIIQAMWIFSFTLCTGITYGITADLIATRRAPSYFLYGHQPDQTALISSNDPNMVALAWGLAATWHVSAIVGLAFAIVALCCPLSPTIMMSMMAAPITLLPIAYTISAPKAKKKLYSRLRGGQKHRNNRHHSGEYYSTIQNKRWWQTGIVNNIGYLTLPVAGIGILTTACVLSTVGLHSLFWGLWLPVGVLSAQVVIMGAAALYMHINQGLKIPDKCYPCAPFSAEAHASFTPKRTQFTLTDSPRLEQQQESVTNVSLNAVSGNKPPV